MPAGGHESREMEPEKQPRGSAVQAVSHTDVLTQTHTRAHSRARHACTCSRGARSWFGRLSWLDLEQAAGSARWVHSVSVIPLLA